ncbi:MAG: phosphatidate cytidylyltransferase [Bacteroidales bacterium]|nr:phosphatidate cytidylyltransferase [Bacteroidales bacterium]
MNSFWARLITGVLFIAAIIGSVTITPWAFALLFGFFAVVGILEFYKISINLGFNPQKGTGIAIGTATFMMLFLQAGGFIDARLLYCIPALITVIPIIELFRKKSTPTSDWAQTLFAIIYVALPLGLMSNLIYLPGSHEFSCKIILSFFVFVWISDTGAYCAGKLFGKHKMFERMSPKKTFEGLAGGVLFTILSAIPIHHLVGVFELWQWIVISIEIVTFANLGDLAESMLKRNADIKDSGKLLPGHGGVLDRFDSALLACPPVWLTITLMTM